MLSLTGLVIVVATIVVVQHMSLKPPRTSASIPQQEKPALPLPSMPSIAVLPFANLSGDPQQEYFSDGVSDQLINDLSRLPGLFVIARNSSFAYKGKRLRRALSGKSWASSTCWRVACVKPPTSSASESSWSMRSLGPERGQRSMTDRSGTSLRSRTQIVSKVVTTLGLLSSSTK